MNTKQELQELSQGSGARPPVPLRDGLDTRPCKILDPRLYRTGTGLANPGNRHSGACIGTLSFRVGLSAATDVVGRRLPGIQAHSDTGRPGTCRRADTARSSHTPYCCQWARAPAGHVTADHAHRGARAASVAVARREIHVDAQLARTPGASRRPLRTHTHHARARPRRAIDSQKQSGFPDPPCRHGCSGKF